MMDKICNVRLQHRENWQKQLIFVKFHVSSFCFVHHKWIMWLCLPFSFFDLKLKLGVKLVFTELAKLSHNPEDL